jgi:hypothetical protein
MRYAALVVGLLVLSGLAPSARAVPVEVTYALSGTVSLPALAIQLGTVSGTTRIRYVGTGANTTNGPVGGFVGPARIQSFGAVGVLAFSVLGNAAFTGGFNAIAPAQANGTFPAVGSGIALPLAGAANGTIHCVGAGCTGLGFAASVNNPIALVFNTVLTDSVAAPTLAGTLQLAGGFGTFQGLVLTISTNLTEISRTAVPEPGTASMVWLGLVGLAGVRWHLRRRSS